MELSKKVPWSFEETPQRLFVKLKDCFFIMVAFVFIENINKTSLSVDVDLVEQISEKAFKFFVDVFRLLVG